ncbi:DUF2384 domain-containing protein [Fibrivirga algicola]|uniref:DUF2384 domain-containing protein n=1 Tax=Fibrivirga algicola TaxID=2950420 RepID=A0ABX0QL85_9BACT|nr:DUF2384 domain-containing protein [Fibrivirga algicola]NID11782.1 DUF2384 domain-containing protein [Fibrivirga algicola]
MQPIPSSRTNATGRLQARPVAELIRQARHGVLRQRVDEIARLVSLTDKDMARILNMSVRSLHGKSNTELLTLAASERLLLLERLVQHGLAVFDGRADVLARWLHTPLNELAYREGAINDSDQPTPLRDMGSFADPAQGSNTGAVRPTEPDADAGTLPAIVPQSPIAVLDTVSGFSLAEDVLGRIEWGIVG